ncbi:hypothetical protein MKX03_004786 [Papaver bracteatum]|nr:hypothetical protein MKX03_004786 [Papaver bracteatum]
MSGNVQVRLCEKGGRQKWPCCTSLQSSMGFALSFLGEYANIILVSCEALHITFVGPGSCNKSLRPDMTLVVGGPAELSEKDDLSKIRGRSSVVGDPITLPRNLTDTSTECSYGKFDLSF